MIEELQRDGTDFLDLRIVRHRTGKSYTVVIHFAYMYIEITASILLLVYL